MLILYMAVLMIGIYWASKILLPELLRPSVHKIASPGKYSDTIPSEFFQSNGSENRVEKLEIFLEEKSKNIQLLEKELKILYAQVRDYDKVKSLLEQEIHRLKEQNRIFRSELGLPTVQPKESLFI